MTLLGAFTRCNCGRAMVKPGDVRTYGGMLHSDERCTTEYVLCSCGTLDVPSRGSVKKGDSVHLASQPCFSLAPTTKEEEMDFIEFVRKPFTVQAVEVTRENIKEIAEYVGDLKAKDDGTPYILVDRRLVPNVFKVYPGFWMTKMGDKLRCYSRRIFREQFVPNNPSIQQWLDFMGTEGQEEERAADSVS